MKTNKEKFKQHMKVDYQSYKHDSKINISSKCFYIMVGSTLINTTILCLMFIITLFNNRELQIATSDAVILNELESQFAKTVMAFGFNIVINLTFVIYSYFSMQKIKVSYVYAIFWFFIWGLLGIGTVFIYSESLIYIKITNLLFALGNISALMIVFYQLYEKKRVILFEKRKKRVYA